nr:NADH dehydrogenase subunit 6 [Sardinops melanostictus]WMI34830.1 NADH dehydrogenase subunit 6 [Sardinops sagax]BAB18613.1 NADH dehydrogenase subunit 6 [Sardinops melanostictus]
MSFQYIWLAGFVIGVIGIMTNPSPYFAALGLVMCSAATCCILVFGGSTFLAVVLFLIYLGGMLVVFAFTAALAADPFPEGTLEAAPYEFLILVVLGISLLVAQSWRTCYNFAVGGFNNLKEFLMAPTDTSGVSMLYSFGGVMVVVCALALLVTLFVVLELTRGSARGALRAP